MGEDYVTRHEHDEFARRMDEANDRANRRLGELESSVKEIHTLTVNIEKMACNMETMVTEQKKQGEQLEKQSARLDAIEQIPAEKWNTSMKTILTAICSGFGALLVAGLIYLISVTH